MVGSCLQRNQTASEITGKAEVLLEPSEEFPALLQIGVQGIDVTAENGDLDPVATEGLPYMESQSGGQIARFEIESCYRFIQGQLGAGEPLGGDLRGEFFRGKLSKIMGACPNAQLSGHRPKIRENHAEKPWDKPRFSSESRSSTEKLLTISVLTSPPFPLL